jgi:hypothetical protein
LGTEDDKVATITLTAWVNEVREDVETKGMDTVLRLNNPGCDVIYLLKDWGGVTDDMVQAWLINLEEGFFEN